MTAAPSLEQRFEGCLLGLAIGDALGGRLEAHGRVAARGELDLARVMRAFPA